MEEAPENGKESSHSAHANGIGNWKNYYFSTYFAVRLTVSRSSSWILDFSVTKEISQEQYAYVKCIKTYFRLYETMPVGLHLSLPPTRVTVCDLHYSEYILLIRECMKHGFKLLCLNYFLLYLMLFRTYFILVLCKMC
jgi:hypothetical protein